MLYRIIAAALTLSTVSLAAHSDATVTVDLSTQFQTVDGFGISQAFQRAEEIFGKDGLSPKNQSYVLDLLFSQERGAGFTILRNGIGSSNSSDSNFMNSIEPFSPGSPSNPPHYTWDHYDSGQLQLALEAKKRGLEILYANAWSAPGYMKSNNDENWGGYICGVSGTDCASGDWMQAYANYLVQYWRYYHRAGVSPTHLGFINEPEEIVSYASMATNGTQAAEFIKVLNKTFEREGIDIELTCCDSNGWQHQEDLMAGLQAVGPDGKSGEDYLSVITGHGYASAPDFPLSTKLRTWETEWTDLSGGYTPYTFYSDGEAGEGLTWADNIQTAFVDANVSAFLGWIGAENATVNSGLITLLGDEVVPSKRFWSMASFSKFVRPGAVRVDSISSDPSLKVSAFQNKNGVIAVQIINNGTSDATLSVNLGKPSHGHHQLKSVTPWITNNDHDLDAQKSIAIGKDGKFEAVVPSKSLVSFISN